MDYSSVHNHHESAVFHAVTQAAPRFPGLGAKPDLLADVACVALNRLAPRYVRHDVDLAFFLTEHERSELDKAVAAAVEHAFGFVQARQAMRARA
jgi:hypothetical protein